MIGDNDPSNKIILSNNEIASSKEENFLGILLNRKFNFDTNITSFCKKAGQKNLMFLQEQIIISSKIRKSC